MDGARIKFDLLVNYAGEYMIAFPATPQKIESPVLEFDGEKTVRVFKNKGAMPIVLSPMPEEAVEAFANIKTILCVEVRDEQITNEFNADVVIRR